MEALEKKDWDQKTDLDRTVSRVPRERLGIGKPKSPKP